MSCRSASFLLVCHLSCRYLSPRAFNACPVICSISPLALSCHSRVLCPACVVSRLMLRSLCHFIPRMPSASHHGCIRLYLVDKSPDPTLWRGFRTRLIRHLEMRSLFEAGKAQFRRLRIREGGRRQWWLWRPFSLRRQHQGDECLESRVLWRTQSSGVQQNSSDSSGSLNHKSVSI